MSADKADLQFQMPNWNKIYDWHSSHSPDQVFGSRLVKQLKPTIKGNKSKIQDHTEAVDSNIRTFLHWILPYLATLSLPAAV